MAEIELLSAISDLMDTKFEEFKINMATKDDIANMATKSDLRAVENSILTEVDRVQEKSNKHYHELKDEIAQLRMEVRLNNTDDLRFRVDRLEVDMTELKKRVS